MATKKQIDQLLSQAPHTSRQKLRQLAQEILATGVPPEELLVELLDQLQQKPSATGSINTPSPVVADSTEKQSDQQQHQVHELSAAMEQKNQDLKNSRLAALNMMEDAVFAKHSVEKSKEQLRTTLKSIGDAVISTDTIGQITLMNPVAETLTGWSLVEATNQPLKNVFHIIDEQSRQPIQNPLTAALETGQTVHLTDHTLLLTKNGSEIPIADSGAPIKNEAGEITGGVLVFRDQTQERASREALKKNEAKYRELFEQSADAFLIIKNNQFIDCNQAAVDMLQYPSRDALNHAHPADLSPERQPDGQLSHLKYEQLIAQVEKQKTLRFEWTHTRANGETFPVDITLTTIRDREDNQIIHTAWRDITIRKEAEQRVEFEQSLFHSFMETLPAIVYFKNIEGQFIRINQYFADTYGHSKDEIIGKTNFDLFPKEQAQKAFKLEQQVMRDRQPCQHEELFKNRWHMTTKAPRYDADGNIAGTFSISIDITDRMHAQQKLEESRRFLRTIIDTIPSRVWWKDQNSILLGCNTHYASDAGFDTPDQLIGKSDFDLCWKEHADQFLAADNEVIQTGRSKLEIQECLTGKDGHTHWIETNKNPLRDNDGHIIGTVGSYTDVTERKKAEKLIADLARFPEENTNPILRISTDGMILYANKVAQQALHITSDNPVDEQWKDYTQQVLNASHPIHIEFTVDSRIFAATLAYFKDGNYINVYAHDITELIEFQKQIKFEQELFRSFMDMLPADVYFKDIEGHFLRTNKNKAKSLGETEESLIGKSDFDFMSEDEARTSLHDEQEIIRTNQPRQFEEFTAGRWHLSTKAPHYGMEGNLIGSFGISIDITDQKEAATELLRLSTAIEQSPETILITNTDGIIQYVNPAFETITGYSCKETIGKNPRFLQSGQHDNAFYRSFWETIQSGNVWNGQFTNRRKNGSLYTENASISPVKDPNGTIINYVAVKRDITEELSKEDQFRQAQKMEAVGQLAGGIAHDFNNILQAILGFSEILQRRLQPESTERRSVDEIQKAAKRAAELTRQLLTFSRKQPIQRDQLHLNETIQNTMILLHVLLGKNIELKHDLCEQLLPIHADHGQITQVIMNLAVNARDAMPHGGTLTLTTQNIIAAPPDDPTTNTPPDHFVCLSITDTGCGMSPGVQERLFEPFFTTKEVGKGTGLGLSVVYGIVEQNKGKIDFKSKEGEGTTFNIYLPALENNPHDKDDAQESDESKKQRILLVEDDLEMRTLILQLLGTNEAYETVTASTAEEAIDLFTRENGRFALLFSFMALPGQTGTELADTLRTANPQLPILLYNSHEDPRAQCDLLNSKGYHLIHKPFTVAELLATVNDILSDSNQKGKYVG